MKGCWDPEFEPSVEEIVDYPMISLWCFTQFAFSSELAFRAGDFPIQSEHMAGEGQPAQAARPNIVSGGSRISRRGVVIQSSAQSARKILEATPTLGQNHAHFDRFFETDYQPYQSNRSVFERIFF